MPEIVQDALSGLSDALVERACRARRLVAHITARGRSMRSGTLWRKDVVVASEQSQSLPDIDQAEVTLADGASLTARVAGCAIPAQTLLFLGWKELLNRRPFQLRSRVSEHSCSFLAPIAAAPRCGWAQSIR